MLDCSPAKIMEYRERYSHDFWQLRTPLTGYKRAEGIPFAIDNGCFKKFEKARWLRLLEEAWEHMEDPPMFVCLPDIVGDAQRTSELFQVFKSTTNGFNRALVLQDGIEHVSIPWDDIKAIFYLLEAQTPSNSALLPSGQQRPLKCLVNGFMSAGSIRLHGFVIGWTWPILSMEVGSACTTTCWWTYLHKSKMSTHNRFSRSNPGTKS